jgi:hypothetical protein
MGKYASNSPWRGYKFPSCQGTNYRISVLAYWHAKGFGSKFVYQIGKITKPIYV